MASLHNIPSFIATAIEDPKTATDSALISTVEYYSDVVGGETRDLIDEELIRRGFDETSYGLHDSTIEY